MFANIATPCPKEIEVFGKGSASAKLTLRNNPFSKGFSPIDNIKLPYEYCPYAPQLFYYLHNNTSRTKLHAKNKIVIFAKIQILSLIVFHKIIG